MLHEMLQFESVINIYKIVFGYNVTQLKGNTTPLTVFFVEENHGFNHWIFIFRNLTNFVKKC